MLVRRSFKYRFYPSPAQAAQLTRTFGCIRLVYNRALETCTEARSQRRPISYAQSSRMLTLWKKDPSLAFLRDVSSVPLQQCLRHLHGAFAAFTSKRAGHPRFKSRRRSRQSATFTRSAFRYQNGQLLLAKMHEPLDIRWSRTLPRDAEPTSVAVSQDPAGRWFVSLVVDAPLDGLPPAANAVSVDLGIESLATLSTGEKIANPRHERRDRKRLARAQRVLARRQTGSANREKARMRVARLHARITDRRNDHLHKLSLRLVRENQTVAIEDLAVSNIVRNRSLARAVSDTAWAELRRMIAYKCRWHGRNLVVVDRWYPSSKLCSACGHAGKKLPLGVRTWRCRCGASHDRDVSAAINIRAAGLAALACGDGVRPACI